MSKKNIIQVNVADIRATVKTQTREEANTEALADYKAKAKEAKGKGADWPFPELVAYKDADGIIWLADGFHRKQAATYAGYEEVPVDVRDGTKWDAVQYGFKANQEHGVRLTNADKHHNLKLALENPEWALLTNNGLAQLLGVSDSFVDKNRPADKAPAQRKSAKTGKAVTATRTKGGKKKAEKAPKKKKGKTGTGTENSGNDGDTEPKVDKELEGAYDDIVNALKGGPVDGEAAVAAIKDGSLPMSARDVKKWAQHNAEQIALLAPLVVNNRWPLAKAEKFLDTTPDENTKADHFMLKATAFGGCVRDRVGDFVFIVCNAEQFTVGEAKGVLTIKPNK